MCPKIDTLCSRKKPLTGSNKLNLDYLISSIYDTAAAGPGGLLLSFLLPRCLAPGQSHTNRPPALLLCHYESSQGSVGAEHLLRSPLSEPETFTGSCEYCSNMKGQAGAEKLLRWSFFEHSLDIVFFLRLTDCPCSL